MSCKIVFRPCPCCGDSFASYYSDGPLEDKPSYPCYDCRHADYLALLEKHYEDQAEGLTFDEKQI